MNRCLKEFELGGGLTVQDVDREIAFALLSLAYEFDRWEIDRVVAYVVRADETEIGRLVIAPGTGASPQVRIREHHAVRDRPQRTAPHQPVDRLPWHASFTDVCQHIRQVLESVQHIDQSAAVEENGHHPQPAQPAASIAQLSGGMRKDSDHFAYPHNKRREIVQHYRLDRINGDVRSKDHWARKHYQISGRTLFNYECEFPQGEAGAIGPG